MPEKQDINLEAPGPNKPSGGIPQMLHLNYQVHAKDFYKAYKNHHSDLRLSPARLFLISKSIELAAKALHLDLATAPVPPEAPPEERAQALNAKLEELKSFKVRHNLLKACTPEVLNKYGIDLKDERAEIAKANTYYNSKDLEYFPQNAEAALTGHKNWPDEPTLEKALDKLLSAKLKTL